MSDPTAMPLEKKLETMVLRKHAMLLYDSLEHYRNLAARYVADGLMHNERCVMATDHYTPDQIRWDFENLGVDMDSFVQKGQLILVSVQESYSKGKEFDPDETLKTWQTLTDKACEDGFHRLRVVGEATFVAGKPELYKKLIYYENIINRELFPHYPHVSMCVYAKDRYPPEVIKAAIKAHPLLVYNDRVFSSNIYFIPPEIYFRKTAKEEEIDRWLGNMAANNTMAQALIRSEEKLRTIFNNANDLFYIHTTTEDDLPGTIIEVNDEAVCTMGYTREEFSRMSPRDFSKKPSDNVREVMQALNSRGHATFESEHATKDGRIIPVEVSSHIFTLQGKKTVFSVVRDITARKEAEERESQLQKQLRLLQKNEAIGTLTGGIAHDFNNILTIIMGYTELAQTRLDPQNPVHAYLDQVNTGGKRARDIIRQLLTFARKEEHLKKNADIRPVIKEGVKMLRSTIPSGIDFKVDISQDRDFPQIYADVTQLHQVLVNLCTNASHAMGNDNGILTVELHDVILDDPITMEQELPAGPYLLLRVTDTGTGISPENMERIFEPYFTTKGPEQGTGLGLSVVQGIVMSHGGGIRCRSEPGEGTTFEVYLPVAPSEKQEADTQHPDPSLPRGTENILFVDDEESLVNLGQIRLSKLGYTVRGTTDPQEALAWFTADPQSFDLIISDMSMPGMNGLTLAARIKAIDSSTPVILCSGFNKTVSEATARDQGIDLYLDKPVDLPLLGASIRKILDRPNT